MNIDPQRAAPAITLPVCAVLRVVGGDLEGATDVVFEKAITVVGG